MVQDYVNALQADPWVWNFLCVSAGMAINTIKVCRERERSVITYWTEYPSRSLLSVLSVYGSFVALMITNAAAEPAEFLAIGYMLDSMLNKPPASKTYEVLSHEVEDLRQKKERRAEDHAAPDPS